MSHRFLFTIDVFGSRRKSDTLWAARCLCTKAAVHIAGLCVLLAATLVVAGGDSPVDGTADGSQPATAAHSTDGAQSATLADAKSKAEEAVPELRPLATHKDANVRRAASAALEARSPEELLTELQPLLKHEDAEVRMAAVAAIGATAPAEAIADLAAVYEQDEQYVVRFAAEHALAKGGEPVRQQMVAWLREGDKTTRDDRSKLALAVSIARDMRQEAVPLVPELLRLTDTPYQDAAHYAILRMGAAAAEPLVELIETNSIAEDAVYQIGTPATPFLLRKAETAEKEEAKVVALRTLNCSGAVADEAYPRLVKIIEDTSKENVKTRAHAIVALGVLDFDTVNPVPLLSRIANDQSDPLRIFAAATETNARRRREYKEKEVD